MNSMSGILLSEAIKASVILIAAFLATFALRRAPASARRLVWITAAACLLVLPVLSVMAPALGLGQPKLALEASALAGDAVASVNAVAVASAAKREPLPWILIVWAGGALAVLGRLAAGMARMWWLARAAERIEAPREAAELETRIGAGRVRFVESDRVAMPMTWGVLHPVILLPPQRREWLSERLRLVLAHELIHVRQRDCLLQILMQAACALYWFHPLMWLGAAQFRKERERACDDGVLRLGINGPDYAGHLLELVRTLKPGARPALAVAMAHQSHLESRLVALLDANVNRKKLSRRTTVLAFFAAVCMVVPLASVHAQAPGTTVTISGVVYDASGAVIPGVTVVATNLSSQTKETAVADPAGEYRFQSIPAGHYKVEISVPGFKMFHLDDVFLSDDKRLDVTMELGAISERLQVIGQKPPGQIARPAAAPHRIRVGGNVQAARLISKVAPVYPENARLQGIEGTVVLRAVISKEGNVMSLSVLTKADPELAKAAGEAVQQWRYQPTLLNGAPVEVLTTITVDFRLQP